MRSEPLQTRLSQAGGGQRGCVKSIERGKVGLAPTLDVYEQALYLYLVRHSRLRGEPEVTVGLKSARKRLAFGVGKARTPPSERILYEKLRTLAKKGCLEVLDSRQRGSRVKVYLPGEIPGILPSAVAHTERRLEDVDFFTEPAFRPLILARDGHKCFYCRRALDAQNYVIEHATSRPEGDGSFRNVVAVCRSCNNRKGSTGPEDFLRTLLRDGFLSDSEFSARIEALQDLRDGKLRPVWPKSAPGAA